MIGIYRRKEVSALKLAFTGHRPEGLPFGENEAAESCRILKRLLWKEIVKRINNGYDTFYCGAAKGADIICGELVVLAQEKLTVPIQLICVVPFKDQTKDWSDSWKQRYNLLLEKSSRVVQLSEHYYRGCYYARDRYMVDHADALIAVYSGQRGGTSYTVQYAYAQKKEVTILNPFHMPCI